MTADFTEGRLPELPRGAFAHRLPRAVTFRAWRENRPVNCPALTAAQSFEEAIAAVLPGSQHKSVVSVLRIDTGRNEQEVRFYRLKQSTKHGYWRDATDGGRKVFVGNLEPELLHALPVLAFEPARPFDALRDGASGRDLTLVENG